MLDIMQIVKFYFAFLSNCVSHMVGLGSHIVGVAHQF